MDVPGGHAQDRGQRGQVEPDRSDSDAMPGLNWTSSPGAYGR